MRWLSKLLFRRRHYEDLVVSVQEHLEEKIDELMEDGMSRKEAEQAARRAFGNVTLIGERSREEWQWPKVELLWADTKYALRQLLKSPAITLIAIFILVLGIGANTAIFTLSWNVILKSLPVPHPDRLVDYEMRNGDNPVTIGLSGPEYRILRVRQKSCVGLLAWTSDPKMVRIDTHSMRLPIQMLTVNSFQVLQMHPLLGRPFDAADKGSRGSQGVPAIVSYDYWLRQFHGKDNVLGKTIFIAQHPVTVVGVMPRAFEGLTANLHPAIYLPMFFLNTLYGAGFTGSPTHFSYYVLGRLTHGASLASAAAEIHALAPSIRRQADPTGVYRNQFFKNFRLTVRPGRSGISWMKMVCERPLLVLELLALFLLILCILNTALVLLARVSGRQHEYALRAALGARRGRLIRQVLVEAQLLAIPGLVGGIFLGWIGARALTDMLGSYGNPREMNLHPNGIIIAFNVASTFVIVFGAGSLPAVRAARVAPPQLISRRWTAVWIPGALEDGL